MSFTFIRTGHPEAAVAGKSARRIRSVVRRIVREPLVHFLLLGVLIFAASALATKHRDNAAQRIVIDKNLVVHFITLYEAQMGTPPSRSQLDGMIDDYVREEVQFREAKRMGLDTDDEIVRRRLASKFAFLQRDLVAVPEPPAEELQHYYDSHRNDFLQPASVTFTHIYFSPDHGGDAVAYSRAEQALTKLQSRAVTRAPELGDRFPLQTDYGDVQRLDLVQQFGGSPIVEKAFVTPTKQWAGPVRSGYGWHLVYVSHREEASVPPLKEIQDKVRAAYVEDMKEKANKAKYDALAKEYVVERAYLR
jgi:hypothetical protein